MVYLVSWYIQNQSFFELFSQVVFFESSALLLWSDEVWARFWMYMKIYMKITYKIWQGEWILEICRIFVFFFFGCLFQLAF